MAEIVEQPPVEQPPVQQQQTTADQTTTPEITPDVIKQKAQQGYQKLISKGISPDRARQVTEKYYNGEIQAYKTRQQPIEQPIKQKSNDSLPVEMTKSLYNGLVPSLLKAPTSIASLATNAVGLHTETIDNADKAVDEWVDKNATAYIDPEHNQGLFKTDENGDMHLTNMRSLVNGLAYGVGMVGQFVGLAALTGGTGDVAEAANGVREATEAGDAIGLAKSTAAYKAATSKLIMTKVASGALLFTPQIYKEGQQAGLSNEDASRLSLFLGPILGSMGAVGAEPEVLEKFLAGEMPGAEGAIVNTDLKEGILKGVEGWQKGAKMSEKDFATTIKATTKSFSALSKRLFNPETAKIAGKEFSQMYLQSAVQKFGEQMYDNMYGDGKEVGKGKFGAEEFVKDDSGKGVGPSIFGYQLGKKAFVEDVNNGIYGSVIGMGMGLFNTPMVNQSLYGYIDGKIRAGKGEEGIGKIKKMADILLQKGKITAEQHEALIGTPAIEGKPAAEGQPEVPAQPAKKGLIEHMAETAQSLKSVNPENLTPAASYDAYNYQNNVRPTYDAKVQAFEEIRNTLAQTLQKPENQNPATADGIGIGNLQKELVKNYNEYRNSVESVHEINKHIAGITATGKMSDIGGKLSEINARKHNIMEDESIAPLMKNFDVKAAQESKKSPDENGVRYKDLKGEVVTHKPTGRKGTIVSRDNSLPGEETQEEHYFQPHHTEKNQGTEHIENGNEVVDRSKYDHNLTSPKTETDAVQEPSTESVDVRQQAENGERVAEGNTEEKTPEARQEESKINDIAERLKRGEVFENLEDEQFYEQHKDAIENKIHEGDSKQPTAEETRAETVERELEKALAEKTIPEEEQQKNSEVAETVINEVAEKDTAVYDALEQGTDVKTDKKVAKEKKAKAEKEPKSKGKKIGKKERNKLILAEAKDYKQAAMQRILGLSELGETLDIDKEAKSEAEVWNANNPKKVTEQEMKQALTDAEKMGADEAAQKLKESLNTDTDLEALTKQTIC